MVRLPASRQPSFLIHVTVTMPRLLHYAAKLITRVGERVLAGIFAILSLAIPRSKRIWAFGSWYGLRFADNPKYFFLYCSSLDSSEVRVVWLSRSRAIVKQLRTLGLSAYHRLSVRGLWYALRAGIYILDCRTMDITTVAGHGAITVNLWHGVPLKMIERDITQHHHAIAQAHRGALPLRMLNKLLRPQLSERYDYVLATSPTTSERFARAFGVAPEQVIMAGYPRTDVLLARENSGRYIVPDEQDLIREFIAHSKESRRVLLYMPTFRDWQNNASRPIPIAWESLNSMLEAHGGVLYCKLHPSDQARLPDLSRFNRIHLIPTNVDPYPILKHTDALITDYSSIFFDYLLIDRPIVFYAYDLVEYQQFSRAFYDRYEDVTPGPRASNAREFEATLATLLSRYTETLNEWRADMARVRSQAHAFCDNRASERLFGRLLEILRLP